MRKITITIAIALICLLLTLHSVFGLQIIAVQYDPKGSDTDKEWVQLFNDENEPFNISDIVLQSGNGAKIDDWTDEWVGTGMLQGKSTIVVGESQVQADIVEKLDLQNGPDAIRIVDSGGDVLDLVGWGIHEFDDYVESEPAQDQGDGFGLQRLCTYQNKWNCQDTDNNAVDFSTINNISPYYFSTQKPQDIVISIQAQLPTVKTISVDDALDDVQGIQIISGAKNKDVLVDVELADTVEGKYTASLESDLTAVVEYSLNTTCIGDCALAFNLSLPAYTPKDRYNLSILKDDTVIEKIEVEVLANDLLQVELDTQTVKHTNTSTEFATIKITNPTDSQIDVAISFASIPGHILLVDTVVLHHGKAITTSIPARATVTKILAVPRTVFTAQQVFEADAKLWVEIQ